MTGAQCNGDDQRYSNRLGRMWQPKVRNPWASYYVAQVPYHSPHFLIVRFIFVLVLSVRSCASKIRFQVCVICQDQCTFYPPGKEMILVQLCFPSAVSIIFILVISLPINTLTCLFKFTKGMTVCDLITFTRCDISVQIHTSGLCV